MSGRYQSRPTRPLGVRSSAGWRLKWYEITVDGDPIDVAMLDAARSVVDADAPSGDGVGFVIVHAGQQAVWLLVGRWEGDILHHRTFQAPLDGPTFAPVADGGPTACVWELVVHAHERDTYVRHVLDPADGPDRDAYLNDVVRMGRRGPADLVADFERAWSAGDVDGLMALMTDEPRYLASTGVGPGTDFVGAEAVAEGLAAVIAAEAGQTDAVRTSAPAVGGSLSARTLVDGNRAVSFWSYPAIGPDDRPRLVQGVDIWTVVGDRIAVKDAYRKAYPDPR